MNIVIATTTKINAIFLVVVLVAGAFTAIFPSFITVKVQAQKAESEIEEKEEKCIYYNKSEKLISITCKYADFADISRQITDPNILKRESTIITTTNNTSDNNEKVWYLNAGLKVEKNAILDINSNDVTWLKIIPTNKSPNAITVEGILKVDSVKITSWNPETNDFVNF
ncbi:MAG: hypothetical protein ACM3VV_03260 [Deltaproteobacteria bacterium]